MKMCNIKRERIVSIALIIALFVSSFAATITTKNSFAQIKNIDPACTASNMEESRIDARRDKSAGSIAGNWTEARKYGYSWNAFHNAVQEKILKENSDIMDSEITVDFKDKNGNVNEKNPKSTQYVEIG